MTKSTISNTKSLPVQALFDLTDRTAVVTGGCGWLGSAISQALAELNAQVFVTSRQPESRQPSLKEMMQHTKPNRIQLRTLDITSQRSVQSCFEGIAQSTGKIDILVNNAYSGVGSAIEELNEEDWQRLLDTSIIGYMRCTHAALKYMKRQGKGSVINVASMYGMVAPDPRLYESNNFLNPPAYGAAKAAIIHLTKYSAVHLAKYGIRVNCLSPGPFPSQAVQEDKEFVLKLCSKTPLGRIGKPEELKGAIAFLASDASSFVTGHNLVVDGGWTSW
jgi:NAD(P)-dependent dehydrogenase (short-subunit alcohol dehydrogenase family)